MKGKKLIHVLLLICICASAISCGKGKTTEATEAYNPPEDSTPFVQDPSILYPAKSQKKCGFVDGNGNIIIDLIYKDAGNFSEGLAPVKTADNKWGYIDITGKMVIEPRFQDARDFSEGLAPVTIDWGYCFIDKTGNVVMEQCYENADGFSYGLALATEEDKGTNHYNFFIDKQGETLECALEPMQSFSEGLAVVESREMGGDKYGYCDISGAITIEARFDMADKFSENLAPVMVGDKWGYINRSGNIAITPRFEAAQSFSKGVAPVKKDGLWVLINKSGKVISTTSFQRIVPFSEGLAGAELGLKWGFIDSSGNMIIATEYNEVGPFSDGLAKVAQGGKYGYINCNGDVILEPLYDYAENFSEGLAQYEADTTYSYHGRVSVNGYIDRNGTSIDMPPYFSEGLMVVEKEGRKGYADREGTMVIEPQFEEASSFRDGLARVKTGDKYFFIDKSGQIIIDVQSVIDADYTGYECWGCGEFYEGIAIINWRNERFKDYRDGFLNQQGYLLSVGGVSSSDSFKEGLLEFKGYHEGKRGYGFVDKTGGVAIAPVYHDVRSFSEGLAAVELKLSINTKIESEWGFIDHSGNIIIDGTLDDGRTITNAGDFVEGLAPIRVLGSDGNTKLGYINKEGRVVIEPQFDDVGPFMNGIALVEIRDFAEDGFVINTRAGYIDRSGTFVWGPYDYY